MSLNNPWMSEMYVPAYQISATPWVTSSAVALGAVTQLNFQNVTRFIVVKNTSPTTTDKLAVAFTMNGLRTGDSNYFTLSGSESFVADLRVGTLFISGATGATVPFTVIAGLTGVPTTEGRFFTTVTASNGFNSVG